LPPPVAVLQIIVPVFPPIYAVINFMDLGIFGSVGVAAFLF